MRFRNFFVALKYTLALLAVFLIGLLVTLFIAFPRVVNWLADVLGTGAENPAHWVPAIIIDLILILVGIVWVWLPWEQYRIAQRAQGLVVRRGQGRAYIDTESVRQQVYAAVTKVPAVQRAEVTVTNDLGRAVVMLNILTDNAINGPKKKQEVSRDVKKVVEDQLGVQLASEPTINMSLAPIADMGGGMPPLAKSPSPSSPRIVAGPESRRAVAAPVAEPAAPVAAPVVIAPPPAPRPAEPINQPVTPPDSQPKLVEDTEPVSTVILNHEEPKNPLETPPQTLTDTGDAPAAPRPFIRRPFTPPGGSTTLPDLPPIPPRKELPADTTNPAEVTDESTPESNSADDSKQDQSAQSL